MDLVRMIFMTTPGYSEDTLLLQSSGIKDENSTWCSNWSSCISGFTTCKVKHYILHKIYHPVNPLRSFLSSCHLITQSLGHLVTLSLYHLVTRSLSHSVTRSLSYLVIQSFGHSVTRSLGHSVTRSLSH